MNAEAKPHILLVDDDVRLSRLLQRFLQEQDFQCRVAHAAPQMDLILEREHVDLVVLDLMLPGESGLDICRRLRSSHPDLGILMLTGKGDDVDRIIGLEMGADDYLPKPCNPRELSARIQSILRRLARKQAGAPVGDGQCIAIGAWELDLRTRTLRNGKEVRRLTTSEFGVLEALVTRPNRPLTRDQLMTLGKGREYTAFDRSVDVQISKLRRLLEPDPRNPRYLQTVWGTGYVFVPEQRDA